MKAVGHLLASVSSTVAAGLLILVPGLAAQDRREPSQVIEIDHRTKSATLVVGQGSTQGRTPIKPDGEVRLGGDRRALIRITGTNSALHECTVTQTRTTVPEMEQLRGFLSAFSPYALDLSDVFRTLSEHPDTLAPSSRDDLEAAREEVGAQLGRLNHAVSSMNTVRASTFHTLERMRSSSTPVEYLALDLGNINCAGSCTAFLNKILETLRELIPATQTLNSRLEGNPVATAQQKKTANDAGAVLDKADAIVAAAYSTVRLFELASTARSIIDCEEVRVSWTQGRDLIVSVAPRKLSETQRVANQPPLEFKAKALPRFRIAPAVGLALLYAPDASYPKFGTVKVADSVEIIDAGTQNSRVTYGLTLGARLQGLGTERIALHLPELTINPSNDVRAIGLGGALSYGVLKLGGGGLWTRHSTLDDQHIGMKLRDAAFLRTSDRYDPLNDPNWYLSLSVVGWPPFLNSK
jgi:hypothetical protein